MSNLNTQCESLLRKKDVKFIDFTKPLETKLTKLKFTHTQAIILLTTYPPFKCYTKSFVNTGEFTEKTSK